MRVKRRIIYPNDQPTLEDSFPIHYLEPGDSVRVGFEKGTLDKARFELANGHATPLSMNAFRIPRMPHGCVDMSELCFGCRTGER